MSLALSESSRRKERVQIHRHRAFVLLVTRSHILLFLSFEALWSGRIWLYHSPVVIVWMDGIAIRTSYKNYSLMISDIYTTYLCHTQPISLLTCPRFPLPPSSDLLPLPPIFLFITSWAQLVLPFAQECGAIPWSMGSLPIATYPKKNGFPPTHRSHQLPILLHLVIKFRSALTMWWAEDSFSQHSSSFPGSSCPLFSCVPWAFEVMVVANILFRTEHATVMSVYTAVHCKNSWVGSLNNLGTVLIFEDKY